MSINNNNLLININYYFLKFKNKFYFYFFYIINKYLTFSFLLKENFIDWLLLFLYLKKLIFFQPIKF